MIHVRPLTADDLPLGLRLSKQAGWNQTPADWTRFSFLEPDGCFVAEWEGQPVATTTTCVFGSIGWIAMVLVDEAFRHRGIATRLVQHALDYLDRCGVTTARLDATALGRPVYERLGFVAEYDLVRFQGTVSPPTPTGKVAPIHAADLAAVAELDLSVATTPRARLLERLIAEQPASGGVVREQGQLAGYVLFRPGTRAMYLGPAAAVSPTAGAGLLDWGLSQSQGQPAFVDIPCDNPAAVAWARSRGFAEHRSFTRMRRGRRIKDQPSLMWASSGPEKG
jgi:predicted GNAT family acetyltransferase